MSADNMTSPYHMENYASTKPARLKEAADLLSDAADILRNGYMMAKEADINAPIQPVLNKIGQSREEAYKKVYEADIILREMAWMRDIR
jgi:hypothetical protein